MPPVNVAIASQVLMMNAMRGTNDFLIMIFNRPVPSSQFSGIDRFFSCSWRRKGQPPPVFLPEKSHRLKSLVVCIQSMGHIRVGHNLVAKQQKNTSNLYRMNRNYNKQKKKEYIKLSGSNKRQCQVLVSMQSYWNSHRLLL